jgi:hypothetical protein
VIRRAFALLSKHDAAAAFPHGQKKARTWPAVAMRSQALSASAAPRSRRSGEEKEQRRLGKSDAALQAGFVPRYDTEARLRSYAASVSELSVGIDRARPSPPPSSG